MLGDSEIEMILKRMDRFTHEEARMTMAQTLVVVHGLLNNVNISKFGKKLRHLPIPQLIALITITCNQDRSIVLYRNHL